MPSKTKWMLFAVLAAAILILEGLLINAGSGDVGSAHQETVRIGVSGLVNHTVVYTLNDIMTMPNVTVVAELVCVSGRSLGTHNWTGVRLADLLNEAGVLDGVVKVAFTASDSYTTDLTLQDAMRDDVIVAFIKDGAPMGDNTKLVVPGKWGYKWIDDIAYIQLVDFDFKGTYETQGYSDDAFISGPH
jgi:DMSO/TMAO reductase YedYZ molybdopterin-dependent catalytic subunit